MTEREAAPGLASGEPQGTIDCERRANATPGSRPPQQQRPRRIRKGTKFAAVLQALLTHPTGLNRFQAERYGDHVLPSTVSSLRRQYGFVFDVKDEAVPGRNDSVVHCARYSLTEADRRLALELLDNDDIRAAA